MGEQSSDEWLFQVKLRLPKERLPTPAAPDHLEVTNRVSDWLSMGYITYEHAKVLQQHVLVSSRVEVIPPSGSLLATFDEAWRQHASLHH